MQDGATISGGVGNYGGETAVAIGGSYRSGDVATRAVVVQTSEGVGLSAGLAVDITDIFEDAKPTIDPAHASIAAYRSVLKATGDKSLAQVAANAAYTAALTK